MSQIKPQKKKKSKRTVDVSNVSLPDSTVRELKQQSQRAFYESGVVKAVYQFINHTTSQVNAMLKASAENDDSDSTAVNVIAHEILNSMTQSFLATISQEMIVTETGKEMVKALVDDMITRGLIQRSDDDPDSDDDREDDPDV